MPQVQILHLRFIKLIMWRLWAKALGEKASHHDHEADKIAVIRTVIFVSYLLTNVFIISGVIRHWNKCHEPEQRSGITNLNKSVILITRIKIMNALEPIQGTYQQEPTEASGVQEDSAVREVWVG